ncbi:MAG: dTDP-4-dehydrorhamnose 3,5-epimerase [Candidatus Neomarinimicrobiota bacterium]
MKVDTTKIDGILVIHPSVFPDDRGFFTEVYRKDVYSKLGIDQEFVQDNYSRSRRGTIRGLHFQWQPPQSKLMRVTRGRAFVMAVDIRRNSPTLGEWFGLEISEEDKTQVWAPAGFARGFCALSEIVDVQYKCTAIYNPRCESGIRWDDPDLAIDWPLQEVHLSEKDRNAPTLAQWLEREESKNFLI